MKRRCLLRKSASKYEKSKESSIDMFLIYYKFISALLFLYHSSRMQVYDQSKLKTFLKVTDDFYLDPEGLLGKGAFGEVFKGYWKSKHKPIAIKTIQNDDGYEREVETLKTLSSLDHPNIMGYYGFSKSPQNVVYIFMECCPNGTLTDLIQKNIPEAEVLKLFRELIEGMCYINAKGKMHRDLKPDNVLMGMEMDIKISDFGLARQNSDIGVTGKMGTPLYAGPEVYLSEEQENYTENCDVWSAGMILYEMLTGKLLFQGVTTYEQLKNEWMMYQRGEKRVKYDPSLHPNWEYFTNYMLTFDHKKRPSFHQVLTKLKRSYDKMMKQIQNKESLKINENSKLGKLQKFLNYETLKYQVLIRVCDTFTQKDIVLRNQIKYIIMFLCLSAYLCHIKKLTRNLKHKVLKLNEDDDQGMIDEDNDDFDMTVDKYRNFYDHKYNFFNDQLKKNIIPKILDDYCHRDQSQIILKEVPHIIDMIREVKDGTFDVQEAYFDAYKNLMLKKLPNWHKELKDYSDQELKVYNIVMLGAAVRQKFGSEHYLQNNYISNTIEQVDTKSRQQLLTDIEGLRKLLK